MLESTDPMPLSDEALTPEEIQALRKLLLSHHRRSWLVRQARVIVPIAAGAAAVAWQVTVWIVEHVRWSK